MHIQVHNNGNPGPIKSVPITRGKNPIEFGTTKLGTTKLGTVKVKGGKKGKKPCYAYGRRQSKKICLRRDKRKRCIKHRLLFRINKCLKWSKVMKKRWIPATSVFKPDVYYSIIKSREATLLSLQK